MAMTDAIDQDVNKKEKQDMHAPFIYTASFFMVGATLLLVAAAYKLYSTDPYGYDGQDLSKFLAAWMYKYSASGLIIICSLICIFVGIYLMKASGVVTQYVIPPHDKELLSEAIKKGDEKAINEYIRLSSLTGLTGTFTKIGLTGLPLATIVLTIILALIGIKFQKFFDLAQLTLGAFLGSYVQRRQEMEQLGLATPINPSTQSNQRQQPTPPDRLVEPEATTLG